MSAIYRSYEVLVEETAANHKTRGIGKTTKEFKPHHENTCRALRVTHELFQDAVCYYILCLAGLVKNETDKDGEPINRMWEFLHTNPATATVLQCLTSQYPDAPFHKASDLQGFLSKTYGWKMPESKKPKTASLILTYRLLAKQAFHASGEKDQSATLENLKTFAGNWIAILCNENGDTTIPGQGVFDRLHRLLYSVRNAAPNVVWSIVKSFAATATMEKTTMDARWKKRESIKLTARNEKAKKRKADEELSAECNKAFEEKLQNDRNALKGVFLKAFSPSKTRKYCSLPPDAIESAVRDIQAAATDEKRFLRLRYGVRDNSMEQPLFRFLWLKEDPKHGVSVTKDLLEYVSKEHSEPELQDDENKPVIKMPYQETGKEPLFPYFTNCLGVEHLNRATWFEFDKSAFKRAAEEVFKYKVRSDAREALINERRQKLDALQAAIEGDPRKELMEKLLAELGGAIGYGMRRATIGGWADLRQEFLKIANKDEPIDEDDLLAAIEKAREDSGGGFGSGAFFKVLCEEDYHPLWLPKWKNPQPHHPKNFVRWWVLYSEAREELAKVWDDETNAPNPIAFTWPSTENRHGETSFRPLDFDISVTPAPDIYLFDRTGDGSPVRLVRTNAKPPKLRKSGKAESAGTPAFTDDDGNALYPLTLSYRRFKRDRIANADGSSIEAEYAPPLVAGKAPAFHEPGNKKPLDSSASLLPADKQGCWHFMFSFKLERDMQKRLDDETAKIPGEKDGSIRRVKKTGRWAGLNLRWPIDLQTESPAKQSDAPAISTDGEEIEEADTKFSVKKIWCSTDFKPFEILSVDLGVRYAGAWSRARVKIGHDAARPSERVISTFGHGQEIVFDAYDFSTFRLQGEDAKIWRKDKHKGFGSEPEQEKCGSRGRLVSEVERAEFVQLAAKVFPASERFPIPSDPTELKFFPDLGGHLTYRLRRRLGRIRFLFKLRWQINGTKKKVGHEYPTLTGDDLKAFRGEQRFNVIKALTFIPTDEAPEEDEDDFMRGLRLKLAPDELWAKLVYEHEGVKYPLFAKVKASHAKDEKAKSKPRKAVQKDAWAELRTELQSDNASEWNWSALSSGVETELENTMAAFAGGKSPIAEVARFVWPLQDKKWKWNSCEPRKGGKQSVLERDDSSNEAKRFIHGMRGLSMKRIRLMQDFRQCCQSLAKLERRYYTDEDHGLEPSPVRRGDSVHEPVPAFHDKINELRKQRVNQTAHMILAEALGLDLMNPAEVEIDGKSKWQLKSERDLHGRYKQKKPRVAAIVLEDLSRYRTSQDRSRYENSQLMEWSHRAIIAKLQDMAQVFGVQIITVDARFSSRFCSRTGVPGIRCAQVAKGFENEYPWKKWAEEKDERAKLIQSATVSLNKCDDPKFTLVLPMDGGPAFFPVIPHVAGKEGLEANADINAAVNIGLRAVSHPDRLDIFQVLRTEAKSDSTLEVKNRRGSLSEPASSVAKRTTTPVVLPVKDKAEKEETVANEDASGDEELESGRFPYLYAAVRNCVTIDGENRYQLPRSIDGREVASDEQASVSAARGKIFWSRVKQACWKRIKWINAQRLQGKGIKSPADWLNL